MSRIGCGYNAFANEADALHYLKTVFGDAFVTFTPAIRNNKFFVLDDMQLEGTTSFMDVDSHFYPIPAFGTVDQPPFPEISTSSAAYSHRKAAAGTVQEILEQ